MAGHAVQCMLHFQVPCRQAFQVITGCTAALVSPLSGCSCLESTCFSQLSRMTMGHVLLLQGQGSACRQRPPPRCQALHCCRCCWLLPAVARCCHD